MAALNVVQPLTVVLVPLILPVPAADNGIIDAGCFNLRPVDVSVVDRNINNPFRAIARAVPVVKAVKPVEYGVSLVVLFGAKNLNAIVVGTGSLVGGD